MPMPATKKRLKRIIFDKIHFVRVQLADSYLSVERIKVKTSKRVLRTVFLKHVKYCSSLFYDLSKTAKMLILYT